MQNLEAATLQKNTVWAQVIFNSLKAYQLEFLLKSVFVMAAVFSLFFMSGGKAAPYCIVNLIIIYVATYLMPEIGLLAVSIAAPLSKDLLFFNCATQTADLVNITFLLGFAINTIMQEKKLILKSTITTPLLIFTALMLLFFKNNWHFITNPYYAADFITVVLTFFAAINIIDTEKKLKDFINFNLLAGCFISLFVLMNMVPPNWINNGMSAYFILLYGFACASMILRNFKKPVFPVIVCVMMAGGIAKNASMGAVAAFMTVNLFLFLTVIFSKERKRLFKKASVLFLISVFLIVIICARLHTLKYYCEAVAGFLNTPSHLVSAMGILGLAAWVFILFIFYRTSAAIFKKFPNSTSVIGAMAGSAAVVIYTIHDPSSMRYTRVLFGILLAIPFIRFKASLAPGISNRLFFASGPNGFSRFLKMSVRVAAESICLIVLSPLMLIAAMLIEIGSEGPIFNKVTENDSDGSRKTIYLFRTKDAQGKFTAIGSFLESIDFHLTPSLINSIFGEARVL
jgi:hypothetical protein